LPGGPVGPPAKWVTVSNVEVDQTNSVNRRRAGREGREGSEGQSKNVEGIKGGWEMGEGPCRGPKVRMEGST